MVVSDVELVVVAVSGHVVLAHVGAIERGKARQRAVGGHDHVHAASTPGIQGLHYDRPTVGHCLRLWPGARRCGRRHGNAGVVQSATKEQAIGQHPGGTYRAAAANARFLDGEERVECVPATSAVEG